MQPASHRRKLPASLHPAAAPTTERAVAEHPRPPAATLEPAGSQPYPAKRPVPPAVNCQREALPGARPEMAPELQAPAQRERARAWAKEQRAQLREPPQRHHRPPSKSSAHRLPPGHPAGQLPQARRALGRASQLEARVAQQAKRAGWMTQPEAPPAPAARKPKAQQEPGLAPGTPERPAFRNSCRRPSLPRFRGRSSCKT